MEGIGSIIGIISGLIGIFTFATGINSIVELRRLKQTPTPEATRRSKRVARRLWLILPLFGISIIVTAASGLSGSDTDGILSLLLIISLLAVLGFQWFGIDRLFSVAAYGPMTATALTGLGLLCPQVEPVSGRGHPDAGWLAQRGYCRRETLGPRQRSTISRTWKVRKGSMPLSHKKVTGYLVQCWPPGEYTSATPLLVVMNAKVRRGAIN